MKRRGNKEGSIYRRKDGRWEAKAPPVLLRNGRVKRPSFYGATREEAANKLTQYLADRLRGPANDPQGHTLESYLKQWLELRARHVAPTTLKAYEYALKKLVPLYKKPLAQVGAFDIEQIYSEMLDQGLAPRTVQITHTTLFSALKDAVLWGFLASNACERVRPPRQAKVTGKAWTPEEITRFLAFTAHHRLYALFYVALCTGMRRAELIGLHWGDVTMHDDGRTATIHVQRNVVSVSGQIQVKETKTPSSQRRVHVTADVVSTLMAHRESQDLERANAYDAWQGVATVFASQIGGYLDPNNLSRLFRTMTRRAGVPQIGLHGLRRTHASMLIRHGVDAKTVSDRLGHSNVAFTLATYQHLYDEQRVDAAMGLDQLLRGPAN